MLCPITQFHRYSLVGSHFPGEEEADADSEAMDPLAYHAFEEEEEEEQERNDNKFRRMF
jgi:hypothetical protein